MDRDDIYSIYKKSGQDYAVVNEEEDDDEDDIYVKDKKTKKIKETAKNEKASECDCEKEKQTAENIKEFGTDKLPEGKKNIHCLTIIGQIEGHMILPPQNKTTKYEHIIPQLVAIEEDDEIDGLILILNTVGGDVEAGLAIAELISTLSKPTVSLVLGGGHSIGVPMAVSANYSYIASSATMTIHPLRLNGMVIGVPQTYEYFNRMQERVVDFVSKNCKISKENFRALMLKTGELANDVGTVLFGEEAVQQGLIDEVGGLAAALNKLYELIHLYHEGNIDKTRDMGKKEGVKSKSEKKGQLQDGEKSQKEQKKNQKDEGSNK